MKLNRSLLFLAALLVWFVAFSRDGRKPAPKPNNVDARMQGQGARSPLAVDVGNDPERQQYAETPAPVVAVEVVKPVGEKSSEKVVVCFTGDSRTFYSRIVQDNLKTNLIEPLSATHQVDVIFNIKLQLNNTNANEAQPVFPLSLEYLRKSMNSFNPVLVHELSESEEFDDTVPKPEIKSLHEQTMLKPSTCNATENDNCVVPYTLHKYAQCLKRIYEQERKLGHKYDYVYVTRPDAMFIRKDIVMPNEMDKDTVYTNRAPFAITEHVQKTWTVVSESRGEAISNPPSVGIYTLAASRAIAEVALQAVRVGQDCELYNVGGSRNEESQLTFWLLRYQMKVRPRPWLVAKADFYMGIECHLFGGMMVMEDGREQKGYDICRDYNAENVRIKI